MKTLRFQHLGPVLNKGNMTAQFTQAGDFFALNFKTNLINTFQGSTKEGSINNIYLRFYENECIDVSNSKDNSSGISKSSAVSENSKNKEKSSDLSNQKVAHFYPLLGINSASELSMGENSLVYTGAVRDVKYKVTFTLADESLWFWQVELFGKGESVDLVYGQDLGLSDMGAVLTNELYVSQYLGHTIFEGANGYSVCSRQNQPTEGNFLYLQQGICEGKAIGYSTDAMQFFGISSRKDGSPAVLTGDLPCENEQFELSYTALQSEKIVLDKPRRIAFYCKFQENHPDAIQTMEFTYSIQAAYSQLQKETSAPKVIPQILEQFGKAYYSPSITQEEIDAMYPERILEEWNGNELLSFFTRDHAHVVLREKELQVERPHGTILTTKMNPNQVDSHIAATTNYMYGLFNCQTVVGNTSFHKLLSANRGLLNLLRNGGQRIYIELNGKYRVLTIPAVYEMGVNYTKWIYRIEGVEGQSDFVTITSYASYEEGCTDFILEMKSARNLRYNVVITNQLVMGDKEWSEPILVDESAKKLILSRGNQLENAVYPNLRYEMDFIDADFSVSDDRIFFSDMQPRDTTLLTLLGESLSSFQIVTQCILDNSKKVFVGSYHLETQKQKAIEYFEALTCGFKLESPQYNEKVDILNETFFWYTHNAMIHFASPHGLEQPGGAAWGTRDVSQGPAEYFMATQNFKMVRNIICKTYTYQSNSSGEWPQWFMFDGYPENAGECHGDVVFWPLKVVSDYLKATGDISILSENIPYSPLEKTGSLFEHLKRAVDAIEPRFVKGTGLINYAGGDWDDTLQPAEEDLKEKLISSWTVALAFQSLHQLSLQLNKAADEKIIEFATYLKALSEKIQHSFKTYLIQDSVIPGFIYDSGNKFEVMLHPNDLKTGIKYRLLPMTRSIISELVSPNQADINMGTISKHLLFPDGVRLMDRPAKYNGGVSTLFKRAEQAANVGREVSLQYCHAHIRYVEALAKMGNADSAWQALFCINPIQIQHVLPQATRRQSNLYFSSSEGAFKTRKAFEEGIKKLKDGEIPVKGGWRLYSSGPGIYLNQLVSNVLGLRLEGEMVLIDPVLPKAYDGLKWTFQIAGEKVQFIYKVLSEKPEQIKVFQDGRALETKPSENPYRFGGISLKQSDMLSCENRVFDVIVE